MGEKEVKMNDELDTYVISACDWCGRDLHGRILGCVINHADPDSKHAWLRAQQGWVAANEG